MCIRLCYCIYFLLFGKPDIWDAFQDKKYHASQINRWCICHIALFVLLSEKRGAQWTGSASHPRARTQIRTRFWLSSGWRSLFWGVTNSFSSHFLKPVKTSSIKKPLLSWQDGVEPNQGSQRSRPCQFLVSRWRVKFQPRHRGAVLTSADPEEWIWVEICCQTELRSRCWL